MTASFKKGLIFALLTAIISGFSIFYNKIVIVKGVDPLLLNIIKNGGVALILSSVLLSQRKIPKLLRQSPKEWLLLILIAVIGGSIPFILFFQGLSLIPAANAALIQKSLFIWVALIAIPFLHERLTFWQILGYLVVAWSNLFLGGITGFAWGRGEQLIFAATLLWSVEYVLMRYTLKTTESIIVAWGRMFLGSCILIVTALYTDKFHLLFQLTPNQLYAMFGSILFLTTYILSLTTALKHAPVTLVASVLILSTPITNILSAIFVTHTLPNTQIINAIATSVGLLLIIKVVSFFKDTTPKQPSLLP